jgi:hypothetical protein
MSDTNTKKPICLEAIEATLAKRKYANITSIMQLFAYLIVMANTQEWLFIGSMLLMLAEIRNLTKH